MICVEYKQKKNAKFEPHQHICVLKIIPPVWPDFTLTSNIPNVQLEAIRLDTLYVETLTHDGT